MNNVTSDLVIVIGMVVSLPVIQYLISGALTQIVNPNVKGWYTELHFRYNNKITLS